MAVRDGRLAEDHERQGLHGGQRRPAGGYVNTCAVPRRARAKHRDRPAERLAARRKVYDAIPAHLRDGLRRPGSLSGRK